MKTPLEPRIPAPRYRWLLFDADGTLFDYDWASDIQGAVQYGIDACWYNPGRKPRPATHEITREIASLRELTEWL